MNNKNLTKDSYNSTKLIIISSDFPFVKGNAEYNILDFQYNILGKIYSSIHLLPTGRINFSDLALNRYDVFNQFREFNFLLFLKTFLYGLKFIKILLSDINETRLNMSFFKATYNSIVSYLKGVYFFVFFRSISKKNNLKLNNLLLYCFWFNDYVIGAFLIKKENPGLKVYVGGHGHDIFSERHFGGKIPFRKQAMEEIDKVLTDSREGKEYLNREYPKLEQKVSILNSAVIKKSSKTKFSSDNIFRIITLSRTNQVKRIDFLLKKLREIENFSEFMIHYYHIGSGKELNELENLNNKLKFNRFKISFLGKIDDNELHYFFKNKRVDAFLNVSSSEGTSMALIEAMSYSLPVIVTNVGGNKIIGEFCKTLIPINYTADNLYSFFRKMFNDKKYHKTLGSRSYSYWEKFHDNKIVKQNLYKIFK